MANICHKTQKFLSILPYGEENILQALMAPEYWEALE